MTEKFVEIRALKNETLIEQTAKLAKRERVVTAELVLPSLARRREVGARGPARQEGL